MTGRSAVDIAAPDRFAAVDRVVDAAEVAGGVASDQSAATRASWLRAAADVLDASSDELVGLADEETRLGPVRLGGEVARTSAQLRLFADVVTEGSYVEAIIDHVTPSATPPIPDLRRMLVPLGVVAVFAASNFPFAFSVAGGDTAAALAAGNAVVVKVHPGHPRTSRRVAALVSDALLGAGAPVGLLGLVEGVEEGVMLVEHPSVRAVGFTGSVHGGRALFDRASRRPEPIPFFGELGSVNPVVVTQKAIDADGRDLASGLASSFRLGVGQFCTKPGVVVVPAGSGFADLVAEAVSGDAEAEPMLTDGIAAAFHDGVRRLASRSDVRLVTGRIEEVVGGSSPVVFATGGDAVLDAPEELLDEVFGPVTLLVEVESSQLEMVLKRLPGSLTATLHAAAGEDVASTLRVLSARAGRVLFSGWPTGVAVSWAQHHGGPYPSTTSQFTSVGATSIRRFLRPIAYQSAPDAVLPHELRDSNPLGIPQRVDGVLRLPANS